MDRARATWAWLVFVLPLTLAAPARSEERPNRDIPALLVLERFVGTWDVDISVKPGPLAPSGAKARGVTVNAWTGEGRILRQIWSIQSSDGKPLFNGRTDLTYDLQRKVYRNKTTPSQGDPSESEGAWDEKSRTLTWRSRDPKTRSTTVSRTSPVRDGVETWTMVITDANGRAVFECSGTNTRRRG